jgi:hypothetical protein
MATRACRHPEQFHPVFSPFTRRDASLELDVLQNAQVLGCGSNNDRPPSQRERAAPEKERSISRTNYTVVAQLQCTRLITQLTHDIQESQTIDIFALNNIKMFLSDPTNVHLN